MSTHHQRYKTVEQRFGEKLWVEGDCIIWMGVRSGSGYGQVWIDNRHQQAHRVAYEWMRGPIPAGLTLDHLCRVRHCVNPEHLEPIANRGNILRGIGPTAQNARRTHCPAGHPYTGNNLILRAGGRRQKRRGCRQCNLKWNRDWKRRRRATNAN